MIKETIIVEGKDDIANVKSALECEVLATGGYYFGENFLKRLKKINQRCGIIIFTDPDYAGNRIRKKIQAYIPDAKHAFLDRSKAIKKEDIGIENAKPEDIIEAIKKAKPVSIEKRVEFSMKDMIDNELTLSKGASERRRKLADILSIGYCNTKQMINRLNSFRITREEFEEAVKKL
ncbi:MAG: ribonuclease M5 [Tissierellia bacterium]|nr:ribonuclease M5 [Tissierellia bacterium]